MKPIYDATVRDAIRKRMSPPNRESVAQIARDTGITTQTLYNWRIQWQKKGQLVPATTKPPEQWPPADKLPADTQPTTPVCALWTCTKSGILGLRAPPLTAVNLPIDHGSPGGAKTTTSPRKTRRKRNGATCRS